MSAYTIFFCGTGSSSEDYKNGKYHDGELISTLARNIRGSEYKDWIIVDGPASGNLHEDLKWVKPGRHMKGLGIGFGRGMSNNIKHALAVLKQDRTYIDKVKNNTVLLDNFRKRLSGVCLPAQVNLVGWSRGGVTCHMMANAMLNDPLLSNIPVNIFTIDPVPGPFRFGQKQTTLGTNVQHYHAIYAKDEHSIGFTPILPRFSGGCVSQVLPIPGRHATLVGLASVTGGKSEPNQRIEYPQPGRMVRHLVEKQLTQWGTQLDDCLELTEDEMLDLYDAMLRHDPDFQKMGHNNHYTYKNMFSKTRTVGEGKNWFNTFWDDIIFFKVITTSGINGPIFVNHHHKDLVINNRVFNRGRPEDERRYPATFQMLNQLMGTDGRN